LPPQTTPAYSAKVPLFGARKHARQTAENLDRANAEIARLRVEMTGSVPSTSLNWSGNARR
jgi:hypothetical protein